MKYDPSPSLRAVKELHEAVAPLMWAYLVVHSASLLGRWLRRTFV